MREPRNQSPRDTYHDDMKNLMRNRLIAAVATAILSAAASAAAAEKPVPLLVVLSDTGKVRDRLPVLVPAPNAEKVVAQLERGLSREMLEVYRDVQVRRSRMNGTAVEPAYLLLSTRQGGFARYGFYLGSEKKIDGAFVDVHRDWEITGSFASVDQLFPHELAHIIFHQLGVLPPAAPHANQMHGIAVRTDRFVAFNEGFAEHLQLAAVEHPGAAPETRALVDGAKISAKLSRRLEEYRREMTARFAPASRMRISFLLWYSNAEREMRYAAIKGNAFAREVAIPPRLLASDTLYRAYLLENTMPGELNGSVKPLTRLIETEGVISSFFYKWATDQQLQNRYRDEAFYQLYGTDRARVSPLQNVYLKLFHAIAEKRPQDVVELVNAYRDTFPDEAPLIDRIALATFRTQIAREVPPEIWLASEDFETGTTVFDQFRGTRQRHTFDLNAASTVDLSTIPGVTPELGRAIVAAGPYRSVDDLSHIPGVSVATVAGARRMVSGMKKLGRPFDEDAVTVMGIVMPLLKRIALIFLSAAVAGALLYGWAGQRLGGSSSRWRAAWSGIAVTVVAAAANWYTGEPLTALAVVVCLFGIPAAIVRFWTTRKPSFAVYGLATWAVVALPTLVLTTAWF